MRRFAILLTLLAACGDSITEPRPAARMRVGGSTLHLQLSASTTQLRAGSPDTLRMTLTNEGPETVRLDFSSGCQILPYVHDAENRIVDPQGGGWVCTAALSSLTLQPGESVVRQHIWSGMTRSSYDAPLEPLPEGTYYARAIMKAHQGTLVTEPLLITLRHGG